MAWEDLKGPLALGAALAVPAKLYIPKGQRLAEGSLPLVSDDIVVRPSPSPFAEKLSPHPICIEIRLLPLLLPSQPLLLHQYDVPESPFPH